MTHNNKATTLTSQSLFSQPREYIWKGLAVILVYCLLHLLMRMLMPATLGWDDAEQILWAQELLPLYGLQQPPMYTWLVYASVQLFGSGPFAVSVVRYALLFVMYASLFLSASILFNRRLPIILGMSGYLLIYQFAFYSHHDLTHSTLASAAIGMTLFSALAVMRTTGWWPYLLLGVSVGVGMLGKYNFVIFPVSLFVAALLVEPYRKALSFKLLLSLLIAAGLFFAYFVQVYSALDPDMLIQGKNTAEASAGFSAYLQSIVSMAGAIVAFPQPLLIIALLVFPKIFYPSRFIRLDSDARRLIGIQMAVGLALILASGFYLDATHIKSRWVFPALMLLPFYLFSVAEMDEVYQQRARKYVVGILVFSLLLLIGRYGELYINAHHSKQLRRTLPVETLVNPVAAMGFADRQLVGDTNHLSGNLVMLFPDAKVCSTQNAKNARCHFTDDEFLYVWRGKSDPVPRRIKRDIEATGSVLSNEPDAMRQLQFSVPQNPELAGYFTLWRARLPASK